MELINSDVLTHVMCCPFWYHLYNLKNLKNTHGGELLLVKALDWCFLHFLNCINGSKSLKATLNPLSVNFTKWLNTLKQFVGKLPANFLNMFDHFVGLALKGLKTMIRRSYVSSFKKTSHRSLIGSKTATRYVL